MDTTNMITELTAAEAKEVSGGMQWFKGRPSDNVEFSMPDGGLVNPSYNDASLGGTGWSVC